MLPTYYGTREQLSPKEAFKLKKYCKKAPLVRFKNFQIDPAIFTPVNLDCSHCHHVHSTSCCENGQPYSMTVEAEQLLAKHAEHILNQHHNHTRAAWVQQVGFLEISDRTNGISAIRTCNGNCLFYAKDAFQNGFCSIHRYSEQKGLRHLAIKPFSCSLFPIDIIEMDEVILITALSDETSSFSRWGTEYAEYLCVNVSLRETKDIPQDYFPINGYKPAWRWGKELLSTTFGEELIQAIEELESDK